MAFADPAANTVGPEPAGGVHIHERLVRERLGLLHGNHPWARADAQLQGVLQRRDLPVRVQHRGRPARVRPRVPETERKLWPRGGAQGRGLDAPVCAALLQEWGLPARDGSPKDAHV